MFYIILCARRPDFINPMVKTILCRTNVILYFRTNTILYYTFVLIPLSRPPCTFAVRNSYVNDRYTALPFSIHLVTWHNLLYHTPLWQLPSTSSVNDRYAALPFSIHLVTWHVLLYHTPLWQLPSTSSVNDRYAALPFLIHLVMWPISWYHTPSWQLHQSFHWSRDSLRIVL
jgi:hypothetical protein